MATLEATPSPEKKPPPVMTRGGLCNWETISESEIELEVSLELEHLPSKPEETKPKEDPQKRKTPVESKKDPLTGEQAGAHFKESSASPHGEEAPLGSAGSSISSSKASSKDTEEGQHGRKSWPFGLPKFLKRGQQPAAAKYVVQSPSQSPSGESKSLNPSPQSQKSPSPLAWPSRHSRGAVPKQKVDLKIFVKPAQAGTPGVSKGVQSVSPPIRLANITDKDFVPQELVDVSCHEFGFVPVVYDEQYNIISPISLMLPQQKFLNNKPDLAFKKLKRQFPLGPTQPSIEWKVDVSLLYDISDYVSPHIKKGDVEKIAELMELVLPTPTPSWESFSAFILRPLRIQAMGSIVACKLAIEEGWAINVGGGFSHYTTNIGGGLAVYDDVLLCLAVISNFQNIEHIGVINLDAYQSSSYQYAKNINCKVTILDIYCEKTVESAEDISEGVHNDNVEYHGVDTTFDLLQSTFDGYLDYVTKMIAKYFGDDDVIRPSLCIYVGGTTVLADNPDTKLNLTAKQVIKRDEKVFKLMTSLYDVPVAILMGGGYQIYDAKVAAKSFQRLCEDGFRATWRQRPITLVDLENVIPPIVKM